MVVADAADRHDRHAAQHREPYVVDHLPGVLLEDGYRAHAARDVGDDTGGEGPERDRPDPSYLEPLLAALPDGVLDEAGRRAERDHRHLGVVEQSGPAPRLRRRDARIFLAHDREMLAMLQAEFLGRTEGRHVVRPPAGGTGGGPGLGGEIALVTRPELHRLGRVAE